MHKKTKEQIVKEFDTNLTTGLSLDEVNLRTSKYGLNELEGKKKVSIFVKFLLEFKDPLIIILLAAAVISLIIDYHEWVESLIIFIVVTLNAILGVFQENKAEKSLEALKKMSSPLCKVIRDGNVQQVETTSLVPGDLILVEAGDFVPADIRILECSNLQVDESALTGESVASEKSSDVIDQEDIPLGDKKNLLFSSTFITNGRATGIVINTGMNTEIGKIAGMLIDDDDTETPLQKKLAQVSKVIGILALGICVVVFILNVIVGIQNGDVNLLENFKTAVALAVAAIPEGLATVVTIVLAIGVNKMAKEKAVVKKLPAVETLGSTSVVCSDKTGTLTQNKMTVVEVYNNKNKKLEELKEEDKELLNYFALCCDAKITNVDGVEKRIGDPTETALIELNNIYGSSIEGVERVGDLPFDSERKMMTVVVKMNNKYISITKGAPDIVVNRSDANVEEVLRTNTQMAEKALRVLGLGIKEFDELPAIDFSLEENLHFLGLVGMIDPARKEVKGAIETAKNAGIRVVMITGDHVITAKAIAQELGILEGNQKAISSDDLGKLSDEELLEHIEDYSVYARVSPSDKVRIVNAWQEKGHIVSMTGDGVNDSPSLKKADIGCAMGITGTDVAKEASEMILVDDNFATIISAVKEGRGIYGNVKKCVKYLLSSNIGEVMTIFAATLLTLFGLSLGNPLASIHLLWINLITDSLPAFGLGMEKATDELMKQKPRPKNEGFFANKLGLEIIVEGIIIGILTLLAYIIGEQVDHTTGQTMAFLTLSSTQLFHAFNVKSNKSVFRKETFNNSFLNFAFIIGFVLQLLVIYIPVVNTQIFSLTPLDITHLLISVGLAFSMVIIMEIAKLFGYRKK